MFSPQFFNYNVTGTNFHLDLGEMAASKRQHINYYEIYLYLHNGSMTDTEATQHYGSLIQTKQYDNLYNNYLLLHSETTITIRKAAAKPRRKAG